MTPEEFEQVTRITYFGQVNGTRAALRRMLPRDEGAVVLVGSVLAYRGIPLQSAYCAAKHALQGFQDSIRAELIHDRSRVHLTMVQLPAVNTPQFDWIRKRVPGAPKPVGTVFQPEVAARAIWFAAHARRKEVVVGAPAVEAIVGDKLASPVLDHYLAHTAVEGQCDQSYAGIERPGNLFAPAPGDPGAHGRFDAQAHARSPQLWATMHRGWLAAAGLMAAAVTVAGLSRLGRAAH
jgi:hypothetical protein